MIHICTGSRLHFGLLSLSGGQADGGAAGAAPPGGPAERAWGGVGLMVQDPGVELTAREAPAWLAEGPASERVLQFAARVSEGLPPGAAGGRALHFVVQRCAAPHQGLGTGTQLALAVARAVAEAFGLPDKSAPALACLVGRGKRSAVGVHGFDAGGLLVEAGKTRSGRIAPLVARADFPPQWRVLTVLPGGQEGLHGVRENEAFRHLHEHQRQSGTERLCRLTLLGMLPALAEGDLAAFGDALYEYNRLVGEAFRSVQGGVYSHPESEAVVQFCRRQGVHAAGQSSWGPALFAVVGDSDRAHALQAALQQQFAFGPEEVGITQAINRGATVTSDVR